MQTLRIGVASRGFQQPLKQSLKTASDMGARGIQFDVRNELRPQDLSESGRRQFLHLLDELDLQVDSFYLPTRRSLYDLEYLDDRLAGFRSAMLFASQLGARVLTARIGRIPADTASSEYEILRQVLGDLARYGNHVGVTLAVIPSGDPAANMLQLITQITEGPVGVDFDPAGFVMSDHDPVDALRTLHALIVHMQARDGLKDIDGSGLEVPLGRGEVDWGEFVALVHEIEYGGWVTVTRSQGDDVLGDSARAIRYLRQLTFQ